MRVNRMRRTATSGPHGHHGAIGRAPRPGAGAGHGVAGVGCTAGTAGLAADARRRRLLLHAPRAPADPTLRQLFILLLLCSLSFAAAAEGLSIKVLMGLESDSARVRVASVVAVQKSGDKKARRILEGMLGDKDKRVRAAAAEALGKLGDPQARAALEEASKDKEKIVRRAVDIALKALAAAAAPDDQLKAPAPARPTGPAVTVDIPVAEDLSGAGSGEHLRLLRQQVIAALRDNAKIPVDVHMGGAKKGYGLWLRIRSIGERKDGPATFVDVRCEMTLVALPSQALRLSSSATAGAGIEGALSPSLKGELIVDGIKACAPALAADFVDYAHSRAR
jgi:hypothetical protein